MSTVLLTVDFSTETVQVELNRTARIKSNNTRKNIATALKQSGCFDGHSSNLNLRARTSEHGSESSVDSFNDTAEEFCNRGGSFVVRVAELSQTYREVRAFRAELRETRAELQALQSRVNDLESCKAIAFRAVIDEVHKKIQTAFGPKPENQRWDVFLALQFSQHQDWFEQRSLGLTELPLLNKGPNTCFEAGNNAAHSSPPAVVSRIVGEEGDSWRRLWAVAYE